MGTFVLVAVASALLTVAHEAGHWLCGRAAGVPACEMRVRLLAWPPRVDLRDGAGWVSPADYERYVAVATRHLPTAGRAAAFVAGGPLVEVAGLVAAVVGAVALGEANAASLAALVALVVNALYTAVDVVGTWRTGAPCGDASALWVISPAGAVTVTAAALAAPAALAAWASGLP